VTTVWFLPEALGDVEDAFVWYETEQVGLGARFLQAVQSALDAILEFPEAFPVTYRSARRYLVERCPYCLYYARWERDWSWWRCSMPREIRSWDEPGSAPEDAPPATAASRLPCAAARRSSILQH